MLPEFIRLIGTDRFLSAAEVEQAAEPHPLTASAWDTYTTHFQGFTGATLDPQFHRLTHAAQRTGALRFEPGTTALVVGSGPSLRANIDVLVTLGRRFRVITSPRGAEVLLDHGVVPDLVLIEHQTALDAHHTARQSRDRSTNVLGRCPMVAADWRTPGALLTGIEPDALFVPSPLTTWGLWPATAVAMAMEGGATRIGLLGVDLGTEAVPDPIHAPLRSLLELLVRPAPVTALDCGANGARKKGWIKANVEELAGERLTSPLATWLWKAPAMDERVQAAKAGLAELAPILERARTIRTIALDARAGTLPQQANTLEAAVEEITGWSRNARTRVLLQECLGAAFLPRLWRIGIDTSLGDALWRPLLLATDEIVSQADTLAATLAGLSCSHAA
jgi:hypothetical protein